MVSNHYNLQERGKITDRNGKINKLMEVVIEIRYSMKD
jgi:hypothetical protein